MNAWLPRTESLPQTHAATSIDTDAARALWRDPLNPNVWPQPRVAAVATRLGWINAARDVRQTMVRALEITGRCGADQIVLFGMGGSAMAARVFARAAGGNRLHVVDHPHPQTIVRELQPFEPGRTQVVVSSKSGTTVETRSLADWWLSRPGSERGPRPIVLTDPGSSLEPWARAQDAIRIATPPDVGGRYAALTPFGLIPAALAGLDLRPLVRGVEDFEAARTGDSRLRDALIDLATAVAIAMQTGVSIRIRKQDPDWQLDRWLEQLLAESLGKQGIGAPILTGDSPGAAGLTIGWDGTGSGMPVRDLRELGMALCGWMWVTMLAGRMLGIDPFDQPDVESAKQATRRFLAQAQTASGTAETVAHAAPRLAGMQPKWWALNAFLDPDPATTDALLRLARKLAGATTPVMLGWGPGYLHSTGQLQKGAPTGGGALLLFDHPATSADTEPFRRLLEAQARGDADALRARGVDTVLVNLGETPAMALDHLLESFGERAEPSTPW